MTIIKTTAALATAGALVWGASACGAQSSAFTDQTAAEIKTEVIADMQDVTSMTIQADITSGDQKIGLDLGLDSDGQCQGTLDLSEGTAELLSVGGETYVRGDEAFWSSTGSSTIRDLVGDKWAKMPSGTTTFDSFCDLDGLLSEFADTKGDKPVSKGQTGEVDGEPAIELITEEDPGTTHVWVSTSDKGHYILKIEREGGGKDKGVITLGAFNDPLDLTAPGQDEVVDLGSLG